MFEFGSIFIVNWRLGMLVNDVATSFDNAAFSSVNSSHLFTTVGKQKVISVTTIFTEKRFNSSTLHILSQYILDRTLL